MKVTLRDAVDIYKMTLALGQVSLPFKASLDLARLSNLAEKEARLFTDQRKKLEAEYGVVAEAREDDLMSYATTLEPDNGDDTEEFKKAKVTEWLTRFNELVMQETAEWDMPIIQIPAAKLEGLTYTPLQLKAIAPFIEVTFD